MRQALEYMRLLGRGRTSTTGSTLNSSLFTLNSGYDWVAEAGKVYDNAIVLPGINWKASSVGEARLVVQELQADGTYMDVSTKNRDAAEVIRLLRKPNPWYNGRALLRGFQLSWDVNGNAYALIRRNNIGRPVQLIWVPHDSMKARSDKGNADGGELVTGYEYQPNGGGEWIAVDPEQVLALRYGIDPSDWRRGLSPLAATMREICAENEASLWLASVLRNNSTPSMIISPKENTGKEVTPNQLARVKASLMANNRDKRGEPFVLGAPVNVTIPSWSPQQMDLSKIRSMPIANICAALGFDPMVLGFATEKQTFANKGEAIDDAGKRTILPQLADWSEQIGEKLLPMFGLDPARYRLWFDTSAVTWLSDDTDIRHKRVREDYVAGLVTLNEARGEFGLPDVKGGDTFSQPVGVAAKDLQLRQLRQEVARRSSSGKEPDGDTEG
ncbi:MAG: phage portal protein [Chthoniobacterales bacterium]